MKLYKKIRPFALFLLAAFCCILLNAQVTTISFVGKNEPSQSYVRLHSVYAKNLSKLWEEMLYYPDTLLILSSPEGIEEDEVPTDVQLLQNVPNPFDGVTDISLRLPYGTQLQMEIYDLNGRKITEYSGYLGEGQHQFRATLSSPQTYLLSATTHAGKLSIKMVNKGMGSTNELIYLGNIELGRESLQLRGTTHTTPMPFNLGDRMKYIGYTYLEQILFTSDEVIQQQWGDEEIELIFHIPMPNVVTYPLYNISPNTADGGGDVLSDGGFDILQRGVCWSTSHNPTITDTHTNDGTGTGEFTSHLTGLTPNTTHYVRAYATSAAGTAYGNEKNCVTPCDVPDIVFDLHLFENATDNNIHICVGDTITILVSGADSYLWSTGATTPSITISPFSTTTYTVTGTNQYGCSGTADVVVTAEICIPEGDAEPCPNNPTVTDIDGNIYNTVQIGQQCWMRENLRTTRYADNTNIPVGSIASETKPYCYAANGNESNVPTYGYLYNWPAVMHGASSSVANPSKIQGICPTGWHVPSDAEWTQFTDYVSSHGGYTCGGNSNFIAKSLAATTGWLTIGNDCAVGNDLSENNTTGFSALSAGCYYGVSYNYFGVRACFWSATEHTLSYAYQRGLDYNDASVLEDHYNKSGGFSVRCLLGEGKNIPTVTTNTISDITLFSATSGGNVTYDGDTTITARGVCWSTSPNPTLSDSHTTDGSGTGTFTSILTGLTLNTTYYVRAYATNSAGTGYGNEVSFTTMDVPEGDAIPCPGNETVTDIDGNIYNTVQIGQQCWMKENLRTTHYADNTEIPTGSTTSDTNPYRYAPNNDENNVVSYGYLYNWPAVMHGAASSNTNPSGIQGICPSGWHVPSDAEWTQLTDYVSSQSAYLCGGNSSNISKALAATTGWYTHPNDCAVGNDISTNNATGFSALPAGDYYGGYYGFGSGAFFWSATGSGGGDAYDRYLNSLGAGVSRNYHGKHDGFSVRCLLGAGKNIPTVTTNSVSSITATAAICGGNVTYDGDTTVTARGVCWSTSQNPTIADSHTEDGTGTGSFTSNITGLSPNTTYYVRAYATNSAGTAYGNEVSFNTPNPDDNQPCSGNETVTDIDGNVYNTVQIGQQCWMKENLRTTHFADNTEIPAGSSTSESEPYRYVPNNNENNVATYGYLYNWPAVMHRAGSSSTNPSDLQGICPDGWHMPSDAEWTQLTDYVSDQSAYTCGGNSSYIAKSLAATTSWDNYSGNCAVGNDISTNNATGFSALPAGHYFGNYGNFSYNAIFWSTTEENGGYAYGLGLNILYAYVQRSGTDKHHGCSVRCLLGAGKNIPSITTNTISDITLFSATCGGNVTYDGDTTVTARGVCWSTSPNPTLSDSHTEDGSGTGSFTSQLTGLTLNTTYYVRAYATNAIGTAYGNEVIFTTLSIPEGDAIPCPGHEIVTDIDGNIYNTVQIGQQCWMKENLQVTHYTDNTEIPGGLIAAPNYDNNNIAIYGYWYSWSAMMYGANSSNDNPSGVQGICPTGWHLPSDAEWTQLTNYVRSVPAYLCGGNSVNIAKALSSETRWNNDSGDCAIGNNPDVNNATGFSILPAGAGGTDYYVGNAAKFWSTTSNGGFAANRCLNYNSSDIGTQWYNCSNSSFRFSVRCVLGAGKNIPAVTTDSVSSVVSTTAVCGGNVTYDGDTTVTARGVCWSTSQNPTIADSHTEDGTGTGTFTSNLTGLTPNTTYYVRAYATNSVGTAYGNEVSFTTIAVPEGDAVPCPGNETVTDVDGNTYNTVQIGQQCWMKENLRTTHYADGTDVTDKFAPGNNNDNIATYGYLYNWPAVMHGAASSSVNPSGIQGICPTGWHVPSDAEWTQLTDSVGSQSAYTCGGNSSNIAKSLAATTGWNTSGNNCAVGNDLSANNTTGFSALPAGHYGGVYGNFGYRAYFWSSTEFSGSNAYGRYLYYGSADVLRSYDDEDNGFSVRCVLGAGKNIPAVTTDTISDITLFSATCGGNVTSDGDTTVTARGVCWNTTGTPTLSDSYTTDGSGVGTFTSSLTGLQQGVTYYVRAYATNSMGTAYGNEVTFTTLAIPAGDAQPCPNNPTVTDYDGNTYNTVKIGNQCWMKENLRVTHFADGTTIPAGGSNTSTIDPYYYSSVNAATYGYYYNWPAAMRSAASSTANPSGVQGVCPDGWHIPSNPEWEQLFNYLHSIEVYVCGNGYIAKSLAATSDWYLPPLWGECPICGICDDFNTNNTSGFSVLPAGWYSSSDHNYQYRGLLAAFWHTGDAYIPFKVDLRNTGGYFSYDNACGLSVRCVLGAGANPPAVTTSAVSNIGTATATSGGNVTADNGANVTARGVCWNTTGTPTLSDSHTTDGTGTGTFTSSITGLQPNTTYYVRAYATNGMGTAYGNEVTFTTTCATYFLHDDFNDGVIDPAKWTYTGDNVLEEDGLLKLQQNVIDQDVHLRSVDMGVPANGKVAMDRRFMVHQEYSKYYGSSYFFLNGSTNGNNYIGLQYNYTTYDNWYGTYLVYRLDGMENETRVLLCDILFDTWHTEHIELNFTAGTLSYYMDSTEVATVQVTNLSDLTVDHFNVECRPYGWWTGHQHYMDWVDIYGETGSVTTSSVSNVTTTTASCGGNVTSDGCTTVTARGVCWSTSQNPTIVDSHTEDGTGTGSFTSNITGLTPNTTYYVRAYASNAIGTAYGNEVSFTTTDVQIPAGDAQPCPGNETVTDIDGNVYNTVQIGQQCWMKENMRVTHFEDGSDIPVGFAYNFIDPYRVAPNGDEENVLLYGYLYNWAAAMHGASATGTNPSGIQGICPSGWHLPSDAEWTQLMDYVSSVPAYLCGSENNTIGKALASTMYWESDSSCCSVGNNLSANNLTGFSILPAGYFYFIHYYNFGRYADFWSTSTTGSWAINRGLYYNSDHVDRLIYNCDTECYERANCSVRCLLGAGANIPAITTDTISDISISTATCGGNITYDGDTTVTARGVCWSTSQNPTIADSHTEDGTGTGAFTSNLTGLTPNTTYYVRAYATNSAGTAYGEERSFTTLSIPEGDAIPCPGNETVTDVDGNTYNTVQIGQQCWMRENLRVTHYANGTAIPYNGSASTTDPSYYINSNLNTATYGYHYNWAAVMNGAASSPTNPSKVQGVCPKGWHVPSDAEWTQLTDYVGSVPAYQCDSSSSDIAKSLAATNGWYGIGSDCVVGNNPATNNATGLSFVPAGYCHETSYFFSYEGGYLWTSTEDDADNAYERYLHGNYSFVTKEHFPKEVGIPVRCLLGEGKNVPAVTTDTISDITQFSAICGGNVTYDGDTTVTARGVCWSTSQNPTIADSHTEDGTGTGSFASILMGLIPDTTYYVRAYATNSVGTAYGNEVIFSTTDVQIPEGDAQPCPGHETVTDIDGNTYNTVQIGQQCWMKENLRTTHYADNTEIPAGSDTSFTDPYRYAPNNDESNVPTYGYLYNWAAVMHGANSSDANPSGIQGICPTGWHVPSKEEWIQLFLYANSQSAYTCGITFGYIAKALASTTGWNSNGGDCVVGNDLSANNATGFSALPAGYYNSSGYFNRLGYYAAFWSATEFDGSYAYGLLLYFHYADVHINNYDKYDGFSVRCVLGAGKSIPAVTTNSVSSIVSTTAVCGGEVTYDGDTTVTARGVCWSTSQNPTIADSHTEDGTGTGTFTSSLTGLTPNTTYYVRAYASNAIGTAYGEEVSFTTTDVQIPTGDAVPCPDNETVTDIDGNVYNTVQIGQQCWMKENLRTTHYADNTAIPAGSGTSYTDPYRYAPNNDEGNVPAYGYLYNWPAVMHGAASSEANPSNVEGICPTGWHVPSDAEWTQLTDYVGSQSAYTCGGNSSYIAKALASTTGWNNDGGDCVVGNDQSANNATGFSTMPATCYGSWCGPCGSSSWCSTGSGASLWSATSAYNDYAPGTPSAISFGISATSAETSHGIAYCRHAYSVRCILGTGLNLPGVNTGAAKQTGNHSAYCSGEVTYDGNTDITDRGICWSTNHNPTLNDSHASAGTGTGGFSANLTDLIADTTYYIRAYATNSMGTTYGNETELFIYHVVVPKSGTETYDLTEGETITVYDHAGPNADYDNYCDGTLVITAPSDTDMLVITGSYNIENGYDNLYIYDGTGTDHLLGQLTGGSSITTPITTTQNSVTLRFTSDVIVTYSGLELTVTAERCVVNVTIDSFVYATELPLTWYGQTINEAGIYTENIHHTNSCDSNLALNLRIIPASLPEGLVAYYPLDDDDFADYSGHGNNGTNQGTTATTDRFCREGKARNFGGVDNSQIIEVPNSITLQFTDGATVSMWFCMNGRRGMTGWGNTSETGNWQVLFSKNHDRNGQMRGGVGVHDNGDFNMSATLSSSNVGDTLHDLQIGQWAMATLVYTTTYIEAYFNGQLLARTEGTNSFASSNNCNLIFGRFYDSWYPLNGKMDDIRVFNRALSPTEVEQLYYLDLVPQDSLLVYLPMNNSVTDYSGNGFEPIIHGNVTPTTGHNGIDTTAYYFPGEAGSWIEIPNDDRLNLCGSFTVSAWYNRDAGWMYGNLVSKGRDIHQGWQLGTGSTHTNGYVYGGTDARATISPVDGQWYMTTGVYDVTTHTLRYYLNGGLMDEVQSNVPQATDYPVAIGRHLTYSDPNNTVCAYPFKGKIGDIVIYNRPLSDEEVRMLYSYNPHLTNCLPIDSASILIESVSCYINSSTPNIHLEVHVNGAQPTEGTCTWYVNGTHIQGQTDFSYSGAHEPSNEPYQFVCAYTNSYGVTTFSNPVEVTVPVVSITISGATNIDYGQSTTLTASGANSYSWNTGANTAAITVSPTSTTTYTVTGTDSYGCIGTASVTVTVNILAPTVTTNNISNIGTATATCGGNVTADGGASVTARGVCWSTSQNPTIADSHTEDGTGTGTFTSSLTGLTPNTTYYVRAYATNSAGTAYGNEVSFTTEEEFLGPCPASITLTGSANWGSTFLSWNTTYPLSIITDTLSYHVSRVGGGSAGDNVTFIMATRYPKSSMANLDGKYLTHVGAFTGTIPEYARIHIFELNDEDPYSLSIVNSYTQEIPTNSISQFAYNIFSLTTPFPVDTSKSIIIGYEYINVSGASLQVGEDSEHELYNNLIYLNGWTTLSYVGLPGYAWIIDGYFGEGSFSRFDVYRGNVKINDEPIEGSSYYDTDVSTGDNNCYTVRALCAPPMESSPVCVTTPEMPQSQPCPGVATVSDYNGNTYNTVQIGQQCWMRENMRATHYADGMPLSHTDTTDVNIPFYYPTPGDPAVYGLLYNLYGATRGYLSDSNPSNIQGICPTGWHVPSYNEVLQLKNYVFSDANYACISDHSSIAKSLASANEWPNIDTLSECAVANNPTVNNLTGFSFVPHGYFFGEIGGGFGSTGYTWTSTSSNLSIPAALYYDLDIASTDFIPNATYATAGCGLAVRCVKGNTLATVFTNEATADATTATCGGNVTLDGGEAVTARGVCWSTSQNPTISDSHTEDGTGTGSFTSSLTGLTPNTTYYVRAYATNGVGTIYGNEVSFITFVCGTSTISDVDGNVYNTVQIGQQCWMRENLRTTHYADHTEIPAGSTTSDIDSYRYAPNNDESNVPTYGYLYNWPALMRGAASSNTNPSGVQGICPTGWHVPSDAEWDQLTNYVGSQSEYLCGGNINNIAKALAATTGWNSIGGDCVVGANQSANNATGFSALPAGLYYGYYNNFGSFASFWSATELNGSSAYRRDLSCDYAYVVRYYYGKDLGFSVRCLRD